MIINSLLDQDLYKLTMMQAVYNQHSDIEVEYTFRHRGGNPGVDWKHRWIKRELERFCTLQFKTEEIDYLRTLGYFSNDFLSWLSMYRPQKKFLSDWLEEKAPKIKGPWLETILFEVPILAIISELCAGEEGLLDIVHPSVEKAKKKFDSLRDIGVMVTDFGTRRRFSRELHDHIIKMARSYPNFLGTSNVMLARKYVVDPVGTMAHEWLQAFQGLVPINESQKEALDSWLLTYPDKLTIALTDVLGIDSFLRDFNYRLADKYIGVRQDSGDPFEWCEKIINHYKGLGIDPKDKKVIFSDSLTFEKAIRIYKAFKDEIDISFGIGTNLTNDVEGYDPLNIVIKMTKCNGLPVAKISDSPGKQMCEDQEYLAHLKKVFKIAGMIHKY